MECSCSHRWLSYIQQHLLQLLHPHLQLPLRLRLLLLQHQPLPTVLVQRVWLSWPLQVLHCWLLCCCRRLPDVKAERNVFDEADIAWWPYARHYVGGDVLLPLSDSSLQSQWPPFNLAAVLQQQHSACRKSSSSSCVILHL
jgi:hypothetical protein